MGHEQWGGHSYGQPDTQYAAEQAAGTFGWDYIDGQMADARSQIEQAQQLEGEAAAWRSRNEMDARAAALYEDSVIDHEPTILAGEAVDTVPRRAAEAYQLTREEFASARRRLDMLARLTADGQQTVSTGLASARLARMGIAVTEQQDTSGLFAAIIERQHQDLHGILAGIQDNSPLMHQLPGIHFQSQRLQGVSYDIESVASTNGGDTNGRLHLSRRQNRDGEVLQAHLHRTELIDAISRDRLDEEFSEHLI